MLEKEIEKKLKVKIKSAGGLCLKFVCPGFIGVPDRIILMPKGVIAFAELKAPGERLRKLQERRKRQLEALGFLVFCIDHPGKIQAVLDELQNKSHQNGGDAR